MGTTPPGGTMTANSHHVKFLAYGALIGLLLGGLAAWFGRPTKYAGPWDGPDDSPVIVRGGSLDGLGNALWDVPGNLTAPQAVPCNKIPWPFSTTDSQPKNVQDFRWTTATDSSLYASGLQARNTDGSVTNPKPIALAPVTGINSYWAIRIWMRDKNGKETSDPSFLLTNYNPCTGPVNGQTYPTRQVFLSDTSSAGSAKFKDTEEDGKKTHDGVYSALAGNANACNPKESDLNHSICSRISRVQFFGVSPNSSTTSTQASPNNDFNCRWGECSIGIGTPQ
jgi:hypothetical protein